MRINKQVQILIEIARLKRNRNSIENVGRDKEGLILQNEISKDGLNRKIKNKRIGKNC